MKSLLMVCALILMVGIVVQAQVKEDGASSTSCCENVDYSVYQHSSLFGNPFLMNYTRTTLDFGRSITMEEALNIKVALQSLSFIKTSSVSIGSNGTVSFDSTLWKAKQYPKVAQAVVDVIQPMCQARQVAYSSGSGVKRPTKIYEKATKTVPTNSVPTRNKRLY